MGGGAQMACSIAPPQGPESPRPRTTLVYRTDCEASRHECDQASRSSFCRPSSVVCICTDLESTSVRIRTRCQYVAIRTDYFYCPAPLKRKGGEWQSGSGPRVSTFRQGYSVRTDVLSGEHNELIIYCTSVPTAPSHGTERRTNFWSVSPTPVSMANNNNNNIIWDPRGRF